MQTADNDGGTYFSIFRDFHKLFHGRLMEKGSNF